MARPILDEILMLKHLEAWGERMRRASYRMPRPKSAYPYRYDAKLSASIRNSAKYRRWRTAVIERDEKICQFCGMIGVRMDAVPIDDPIGMMMQKNGGRLPSVEECLAEPSFWDVTNGKTSCRKCRWKTDFAQSMYTAFERNP